MLEEGGGGPLAGGGIGRARPEDTIDETDAAGFSEGNFEGVSGSSFSSRTGSGARAGEGVLGAWGGMGRAARVLESLDGVRGGNGGGFGFSCASPPVILFCMSEMALSIASKSSSTGRTSLDSASVEVNGVVSSSALEDPGTGFLRAM